jgi:uncharacterized membrane protein
MRDSWNEPLDRWVQADLIDLATAERIRAFETAHGPRSLNWPVTIALVFGALMVAAGVLLFVSSHWDALSPASRFALVLLAVAGLHLGGAAMSSPALREALHVGGTIALGGGIFLAGQIFNLEERWSTGILLWAIGAAAGWALLRDNAQMVITALLVPAWLVSEWSIIAGDNVSSLRVASVGIFLMAITYLTAEDAIVTTHWARPIRQIGGIAFLPALVVLFAAVGGFDSGVWGDSTVSRGWVVAGWAVALALPMIIAILLRGRGAVMNLVNVAWALVAVKIPDVLGAAALYVWFAAGAMALAAWGVREARPERINFGAAALAFTVMAFYFSQVMDRLGRSASLIVFGILFLAGGWLLERTRRSLVVQARKGAS